ncbi:hypothetical protein [Lentilactobacillus parabuchneri]|uniref:hypothetical protein n=1 Tax=Lentilactobacillus parabuchneri TaxID=152331 RepID=UPI00159EE808
MRRATGDAISKKDLSEVPELGASLKFFLEVSICCVGAHLLDKLTSPKKQSPPAK